MWGLVQYARSRARSALASLAHARRGNGTVPHGLAVNTATRSKPAGGPSITTLIEARHKRQAGNTSRAVMSQRVKRHAILSRGVCSDEADTKLAQP